VALETSTISQCGGSSFAPDPLGVVGARIGGRILIARQALVVLLSGGVPQVALSSAL